MNGGPLTPQEPALARLLTEHPLDDSSPLVHLNGQSWTAGEIRFAAKRLARDLRAAGVTAGQPVAALVSTGPGAIIAMFGSWLNGSPYVPINVRLSDDEIRASLGSTRPALVMVPKGRTAVDGPWGSMVEIAELEWQLTTPAQQASETPAPDVAVVLRTSGTTGTPRAVLHTHDAMLAALDTVIGSIRRDSTAAPPPNLIPVSLALTAGIYNTLFAFRVGAPVVLLDRFSATEFAEVVRRHGIRSTVLAPAMMSIVADDERIDDLSPLRFVRSITAPLLASEARRFHERFGVAVLNSYGQTELGGEVVGWTAEDWRRYGADKLGSVGRAHPGVGVRILDAHGNDVAVDERGAIHILSPYLTKGFVDDGSLLERMRDGHVRTGDLGRLDADGFLWIEGRESDMINRGGHKVMPVEVEGVLRNHPLVRDACVAGIPDRRLGEVPVAWIVASTDESAAVDEMLGSLDSWCRQSLAPYKVPVAFHAVDSIPRSEIGKALRAELVAGLDAG